jgi:uncharacterized integral membrane protein
MPNLSILDGLAITPSCSRPCSIRRAPETTHRRAGDIASAAKYHVSADRLNHENIRARRSWIAARLAGVARCTARRIDDEGGGAMKYLFVAVVASAATMFALQNTTPISLRFLFWSLPQTPLASVILASFAAGIVLVALPFSISRWRLRAKSRTLEARLAEVEGEARRLEPPADPPATS